MELKCEDYYFYPNGKYKTFSKWDSQLYSFDNDCHEISTAVRIFGTQKQIHAALDDICTITGLNLDETFTYETEKKGSYWEEIVFSETRKDKPTLKEYNNIVNKKLTQYKEAYKINKRALILNLK
tara:strand:+ start:147 stop:521 length:375 start_codon:yes stop_codon:yes gene_type:complete